MSIIAEISNERQRQISAECYDSKHDDCHDTGLIALAAAAHAIRAANLNRPLSKPKIHSNDVYPEEWGQMKMHPQRRSLIIAAALLVAEIERLDRRLK